MLRLLKSVLSLLGKRGLVKYMFLGLLSGCCSFLFINFVTKAVGFIIADRFAGMRLQYTAIFASTILLFVVVRRTLALGIIRLSQALFWNMRRQILSSVLNANYRQLCGKKMEIQAAMTNDVSVLTSASLSIIDFFTASILAVASLAYLASISVLLFLVTLVVASAGTIVYHYGSLKNSRRFEYARKLERSFFKNMHAILDGFKEIYMEPKKGQAIYDEKIKLISQDANKNNVAAFTGFLNNQITGQILFYVLISTILIFFSFAIKIKPKDIVSFVFTLLYLLGALETIMTAIPGLARAKVSSDHLLDLTADLNANNSRNSTPQRHIKKGDLESIRIKNLEFEYGDQEQDFRIGPVDFDVRKGEIIFIYGGNGSGKTTFIWAIMGLEVPTAGEIRLNDIIVTDMNYPEYRTAFAVVFSDFHLFSELYGLKHPDPGKFDHYLRLFELEGKVKLEGNCFSTTDLSMGQRKRLALIACLLEEKAVLILDEWAADQDPHFRKKFYTEIIPWLKKEGITVIAITHDDKYYHCADRVYKMEFGKLAEKFIGEYALL
jgi:cyclic peptide transporter